ncbi:hypothetical protein I2F27_10225 [Acinetobacter sp. B5B]|uniref:relaxase/mobilization nuclease domain-containing protein n=1 Tax=Acinetobacter baretiae TaxID=2605383 RepID=UPI0018C2EADB|nr:hypothetical protein [Acinetobacter baretiae]MBF7683690.1 hypothetical protein [Acinetobacter baretiae]MBF7686463.1 hypothetical protein [Acinetobacter baretiae]
MLIKFLEHGKGAANKASAYVLDSVDHLNRARAGVDVLRGDPMTFSSICDSSPHLWKYTSAVIAWAKDDDPSDVQIQEVLDEFEKHAFAGLEPHQYHLFATQHVEDDGSKHIHILVPRLELETGKSLNIAPPRHENYYAALRDYLNYKYNWSRPDDPLLRATTKAPHHVEKITAQVKKILDQEPFERLKKAQFCRMIDHYVKVLLDSPFVQNRTDIAKYLRELDGIKSVKEGKNYLTVTLNDEKKHRLKGNYYNDEFEINAYREHLKSAKYAREAAGGNEQHAKDARELCDRARASRANYNENHYKSGDTDRASRNAIESNINADVRNQQSESDQDSRSKPRNQIRNEQFTVDVKDTRYNDSHYTQSGHRESESQNQTSKTDDITRSENRYAEARGSSLLNSDWSSRTINTEDQTHHRRKNGDKTQGAIAVRTIDLDDLWARSFFDISTAHEFIFSVSNLCKRKTDRDAKKRDFSKYRNFELANRTDAEPVKLLTTTETTQEIEDDDSHERGRQIYLESARIIEERKRIAERVQQNIDRADRTAREYQLRTNEIIINAQRYQENTRRRKSTFIGTSKQIREYINQLKTRFSEQFRRRIAPIFTAVQALFARKSHTRHESIHDITRDQGFNSVVNLSRNYEAKAGISRRDQTRGPIGEQLSRRIQDIDTTTLSKAIAQIELKNKEKLEHKKYEKDNSSRFDR